MFTTIFTVHHETDEGSGIYTAYFENYNEAKAFVEQEVKQSSGSYEYEKRLYSDVSFQESWTSYSQHHLRYRLDDNSWITDHRANGGILAYLCGLPISFSDMTQFRNYLKQSQAHH